MALRYLYAQPQRLAYLTLTVLLVFAAYILLVALGSPFSPSKVPNTQAAGTISIGVLGGSSLGTGLPASYAEEIGRLAGIRSVYYANFIQIQCRQGVTAVLNGQASVNAPTESEIPLSKSELRAWEDERNAVIVGYVLAARCHWQKGALLSVQMEHGNQSTFKIHIAAVYHAHSKNPVLNQIADAHFQYLNNLKPPDKQGSVMWMSAKATNPHKAAQMATIIDAHFAKRSPPTRSSAVTSSQGALAQFGNVLKIVEFVMAAIFACALLVTVNVAAHGAAERRSQFSLLHVLGFSRAWLVTLAAAELLYVAILGCGLGLALGLALLRWVVKPLLGSVFSGFFTVSSSALYLAPAIVISIVLISVLIPAREIFKLRTASLTAP